MQYTTDGPLLIFIEEARTPLGLTRSATCHFFREDEQAAEGLSIRDESKAGSTTSTRRQRVDREVGQERPVSVRQQEAVLRSAAWRAASSTELKQITI